MGRRTSARGGGGAAWPSTASALVAGDGSSVTVGSGLSLSGGTLTAGGGTRGNLPLDANTLLAWYCDETSGTTLVNSGSTATANLALTGTYTLGDQGLYSRGTTATRFYAAAATDGAFTTASQFSIAAATLGTAFTLEAIVAASAWSSSTHQVVEIATTSRTGANQSFCGIYVVNGQFTCQFYHNLNNYSVATTNIPMGTRMHVAFVRNAGTLTVYVNGVQIAQTTGVFASAITNPLTQASIGNSLVAGGGSVFKGLISDVRFSNTARSQAYLNAATKAMGGL